MQKFLLSLIVFFVLELLVLIQIGSWIGGFNTIALMFLMMIVGIALIKMRFRQTVELMQQGAVDIEVIFLPLAGMLFLFPGFISDILALILICPLSHKYVKNYYASRSSSGTSFVYRNGSGFTDIFMGGNTVDTSATVVDEKMDEHERKSDTADRILKDKVVIEDAQIIDDDDSEKK